MSRPACQHWAQHKCNYGNSCRFSHDGPGGPGPGGAAVALAQAQAAQQAAQAQQAVQAQQAAAAASLLAHDPNALLQLLGASGLGAVAAQPAQQPGQVLQHVPTSSRICTHWQQNKCDYGNACAFRHEGPGAVSGRNPPGLTPNVQAQQLQQLQQAGQLAEHVPTSSRVCNHWQQGKCDYGNACAFRHEGPGGVSGRSPPNFARTAQQSVEMQPPPPASPHPLTMQAQLQAQMQAQAQMAVSPELLQANSALASLGIDLNSLLQAASSPLQVPSAGAAQAASVQHAQLLTEEMQELENLAAAQGPGLGLGGERSSTPCQHWTQFKCEYGDACKFSHDGPGGPSSRGLFPGSSLAQQQVGQAVLGAGAGMPPKKDRICAHWQAYKCNYGDACSFKHEGPGGTTQETTFASLEEQLTADTGEAGSSARGVRFSPY